MELNFVEITGLFLFLTGLFGLTARHNIVKSILSIGVMDIGVILFFLGSRFVMGMRPPIGAGTQPAADPVPQALMITAIVIGAAVTCVALMMFTALYHRYGTSNWDTAHRIRKEEKKR